MLCATFLMSGCDPSRQIEVKEDALFCDIEEPRRFSQAELDWRAANAPWNLRRDIKTNTAWEREECDQVSEERADNG